MTDRATARHRATQRAATPLSSLSSAVSEHVGSLSRGGVVIAMSSGLVATMGLPAQAVTKEAPVTASLDPALSAPVATLTLDTAFLAVPEAAAAPISASAAANVTFDTAGFTATKATRPRAQASTSTSTASTQTSRTSTRASRTTTRPALPQSVKGSGVLAIASRYFGTPYRWGGTTPSGFDCSGFVRYVFSQAGISLPRTANAQMLATRRVSRSEARPGDLVFFVSGGRAYHVGIYVGGGYMYDSPRTGRTIGKHAIWSSSVVYGRP